MKKLLVLSLIFFSIITSAYRKPDVYEVDATKNGYIHNNRGLMYMREKCYYAAIQEFKIAISLNPDTQATSVYYNNIGDAYMKIGYPDYAQDAYERAIHLYSLNFQYYQDLAKCYKARNTLSHQIKQYSNNSNPLNRVMLGLLYIESGDVKRGVIILDDFAMSEPDLLITRSIKQYIKEKVRELN